MTSFSILGIFTVVILFFFGLQTFSNSALAEELPNVTFISNLKQGDSGPAVLALQKLLNNDSDTRIAQSGIGSPGQETNYFGALTKSAVIRFQEKYRSEVLTPAGLSSGTGYVGAMTIAKLNSLIKSATAYVPPAKPVANTGARASNPSDTDPNKNLRPYPEIFSVSPERVRPGDLVTIKGKNFTPTNNMVILGDGPVKERFDNLASFDGQTLNFVYQPPKVDTMTKEEILDLPPQFVDQIKTPIEKVGLTLDDALNKYKGINSESELKSALEKNGHSLEDIYHYFYILVFNSQGNAISNEPILYGLPDLPFNKVAGSEKKSILANLGERVSDLVGAITPVAVAQSQKGGGFTTGIIMVCTCGGGFLTFQMDYAGGGTGLYYFSPGFLPNVGSGLIFGPWLGGYQIMGGTCSIYAGIYCISIYANTPQKPVGYAL